MESKRKVTVCVNCREAREIAAHGLCYKCYRREERVEDYPWAAADRNNRQLLKSQKKLRKVVTAILNSVDDGIDLLSPEDVDVIRRTLKPYVERMATGLPGPETGETGRAVNSEQTARTRRIANEQARHPAQ